MLICLYDVICSLKKYPYIFLLQANSNTNISGSELLTKAAGGGAGGPGGVPRPQAVHGRSTSV